MFLQIQPSSAFVRAGRRLGLPFKLSDIPLDVPPPRDTKDLNVRLDRLQRAEQSEQSRALAVLAQPLIGGNVHRERSPAIAQPIAEHTVSVYEADRRPHRTSSRAPRSSTITSPLTGARTPGSCRTVRSARRQMLLRTPNRGGRRSCATPTSTAPGPL